MEHRLQGYAKMMVWLLGVIVILWFLALIVDQIQPLRDLDAYFMNHPGFTLLLNTTLVGMLILGGVLLVFAQFLPAPRKPQPVETPPIEYKETKEAGSHSISGETSASAIKEAWRQGSWRSSRPWLVLFVMMFGAFLMLVGLFGFLFVIGPPLVKVICAGALIYALFRTFRMFQKA